MYRRFSAINNINNNIDLVVDPTSQPLYTTKMVEVEDVDRYGVAECGSFTIDEEEAAELFLSRYCGQPEPELYPDDEREELKARNEITDEQINALDLYYELKWARDKHPLTKKWEHIRYLRNTWRSQAIEDGETVWLPVDRYDRKVSERLNILGARGEEPTDEQWVKAMSKRSALLELCARSYQCKHTGEMKYDYRGYQGQTRLTRLNDKVSKSWNRYFYWKKVCQNFWSSDEGQELNEIRAQVTEAWNRVEALGADRMRSQYWAIRRSTIDLNSIWGQVSERDPRDPKKEIDLNEENEGFDSILDENMFSDWYYYNNS